MTKRQMYEKMLDLGMVENDFEDRFLSVPDDGTENKCANDFANNTCKNLVDTMNFVDELILNNTVDKVKQLLTVLFYEE